MGPLQFGTFSVPSETTNGLPYSIAITMVVTCVGCLRLNEGGYNTRYNFTKTTNPDYLFYPYVQDR
jgi:hypothetical protein